jgi:hypothetical protein
MLVLDMYSEGVITKTEAIYMVEPLFLVTNFQPFINEVYTEVQETIGTMPDLQQVI